jgi:hypothetical protein
MLADVRKVSLDADMEAKAGVSSTLMARHPAPRATNKKHGSDSDTGEHLAQAFSDIELLAAADVIRAAITEGKKHVDVEALKEVLGKLASAYNSRKRVAR